MRLRWISCLPLAVLAANVSAQILAVPPAVNRSGPFVKTEVAPTLLTSGGQAYAITLPPPSASEMQLKQATVSGGSPSKSRMTQSGKGVPLKIGFGRALPDGDRPLYLSAMPWQPTADGGRAVRIEVTSPGAGGIRVALVTSVTDPDVSFRFAESGGAHQVYGPVPANKAAASKPYWSPVLEGDTAIVEVYLPADVDPASVQLAMPQISHLVRAGASLVKAGEPTSDIGDAGACELDVVCAATVPNLNQSKAVAKMLFTTGGDTFVCTGTLLNDSIASNTPYFFTAAHCMSSQEAASNLFTYWFFDAVSCRSPPDLTVPAYKTLASGAMLLGRSVDYDWALVRLNAAPPPGAIFSAWRAEPLAASSAVSILHHPEGDLKKVSQGNFMDAFTFSDGSLFSEVGYSQGVTEAGSSGSGLLTLGSSGTFYELRGGLYAGTSACAGSAPSGTDVYSRLDIALPLVTQYLAPDAANPAKKTVVVEYYAAILNDYFITADKTEISGLDAGAHPGWVRTGLTFLAYSDPTVAPADALPVCRYYVLPQFGDSHFYSADPIECAPNATNAAWVKESSALFYIQVPDKTTGACAANTRPIYRFLNASNQIHHRYTAEVDARNCMYNPNYANDPNLDKDLDCSEFAGTWLQEGYGAPPAAPVMCGPAS